MKNKLSESIIWFKRVERLRWVLFAFALLGGVFSELSNDESFDPLLFIAGILMFLAFFGNFFIGPLLFFNPGLVKRTSFTLQAGFLLMVGSSWIALFVLYTMESWLAFIPVITGLMGLVGYTMVRDHDQRARRVYWKAMTDALIQSGWTMDKEFIRLPHHLLQIFRLHQFSKVDTQIFEKKDPAGGLLRVVMRRYVDITDNQKLIVESTVYVAAELPGTISGWAIVMPEQKQFAKFFRDFDLESFDFNHKVYVHAEPHTLGTKILSPDIMDWYSRLPNQPWLHLEKNSVALGFGPEPSLIDIQTLATLTSQIAPMIKRSGALDPVRDSL